MLDSDMKPWLLEVNHAPSFNTDTKFDKILKRELLIDTFRLLNVSVEQKQTRLAANMKQKSDWKDMTQTLQKKKQVKNKQVKENHRLRSQYELQNLGNYERIFPPTMDLDSSASLDPAENKTTPEDALEKLSQKYEKFLKSLYNYEGELQLRKYIKEKEQFQREMDAQKAK